MQDINPGILFECEDESFAIRNLEGSRSLNGQRRHGDIVWQVAASVPGQDD